MLYKRVNISPIPNDKKMVLRIDLYPEIFSKVCEIIRPSFPEDINSAELKETIISLLDFDISSYTNLCIGPQSLWEEHVGFTEKVFVKLSDEGKTILAILFIKYHQIIKTTMAGLENAEDPSIALSDLCKEVSDAIINIDKMIGLFDAIKDVAKNIPIPKNPDLGLREQDTEEMTFYPEHIRSVFYITITAKMFLPLFAVMLSESKTASSIKKNKDGFGKPMRAKSKIVDNKTKEIYCLALVEKLFEHYIPEHYEKFINWLAHFANKNRKIPNSNQCSSIFRNITLTELIKMTLASIICKRCVNIGLFSQSDNIMGVIKGAIKTTVESIEKDTNQNAYFIRQVQGGNDDATTNESHLETNSMRSKDTFQTDLLITLIFTLAVEKYTKIYGIEKAFLDRVVNFNIAQNPPIEDFILPIMTATFYDDFKSGLSIPYLDYQSFITLLSLTQIICAKRGMFNLAHRLTAQRNSDSEGNYELKEKTISDAILVQNAFADARNILDSNKFCKTRFSSQEKGKTINKEIRSWIRELSNFLTTYQCYYRTEPELAKMMGMEDPYYQGPFILEPVLLKHYCSILEVPENENTNS